MHQQYVDKAIRNQSPIFINRQLALVHPHTGCPKKKATNMPLMQKTKLFLVYFCF